MEFLLLLIMLGGFYHRGKEGFATEEPMVGKRVSFSMNKINGDMINQ
jgi:hypothetical protein